MKKLVVVSCAALVCAALVRCSTAKHTREHKPRSGKIALPHRTTPIPPRAMIVRGTVTNLAGAPIADAHLAFGEAEAYTDEHGRYEVGVIRREIQIEVTAESYMHEHRWLELGGPREIDFRLRPGASLRGRVVTENGTACRDPELAIEVAVDGFGSETREATGDRDGVFFVDGLQPGEVTIRARGPGCVTKLPTELDLDLGEQKHDVRVIAERAFSIAGTVVRRGTQDGVAGVTVTATQGHIPREGDETVTDAHGRFTLNGFAPGSSTDLETKGGGTLLSFAPTVDVQGDTDVRLEVDVGRTVRGRVVPARAAKLGVDLRRWDLRDMENRRQSAVAATTDLAGGFTMTNVPDGDLPLYAITDDGWFGQATIDKTGDIEELVIRLAPQGPATLVARFVDDTGAALAYQRAVVGWLSGDVLHTQRELFADADGVLNIPNLPFGSVFVETSGHDEAKTFELASGERRETIVIAKPRAGTIRGRVVTHDGRPVANALVHPVGSGQEAQVVTAADGTFEVGGFSSEVTVKATTARRDRSGEAIAKPDEPVTIVLDELYDLEIRVADAAGRRAPSFQLTCQQGDRIISMSEASLHAGRLRAQPPGPIDCEASVDTSVGLAHAVIGQDRAAEIVITQGNTKRFDLDKLFNR